MKKLWSFIKSLIRNFIMACYDSCAILVYDVLESDNLTRYTTVHDLNISSTRPKLLPANLEYILANRKRAIRLAKLKERIEKILGGKITITSAARSPELNIAVNGSATSQHVDIDAVDFRPPQGMSKKQAVQLLRDNLDNWGQILLYNTFIHVSYSRIGISGRRDLRNEVKKQTSNGFVPI